METSNQSPTSNAASITRTIDENDSSYRVEKSTNESNSNSTTVEENHEEKEEVVHKNETGEVNNLNNDGVSMFSSSVERDDDTDPDPRNSNDDVDIDGSESGRLEMSNPNEEEAVRAREEGREALLSTNYEQAVRLLEIASRMERRYGGEQSTVTRELLNSARAALARQNAHIHQARQREAGAGPARDGVVPQAEGAAGLRAAEA